MITKLYPKCPTCNTEYAYISTLSVYCINTDCRHFDQKHTEHIVEELAKSIYSTEDQKDEKSSTHNLELDFDGTNDVDNELKNYINDFSGTTGNIVDSD